MATEVFPVCPSCGERFAPGQWWTGANYCRGLFLLSAIGGNPGSSAWELSQATSMPYRDVTKGLQKLREWALVGLVAEERDQGGIRYRYFPSETEILDSTPWDNFKAKVREVESRT